ncbi:MAG TPA: TRAP transporter small permease [Syntrophales bacterium]|nr:TRAP transporter small permease [Syntrophales bacterium]
MDDKRETNIGLRILDRIDVSIAPIILVIIFVDVLLQILSRILPGNALPWTVEVGETLLGFIIWFGISVAARNNNHITFDLVVRNFGPQPKKIMGLIAINLFIIYLVWLGGATIELLRHYHKLDSKTTILQVSMFWVRLPILIGCITTIIRLAIKEVLILRNREQAFSSGDLME